MQKQLTTDDLLELKENIDHAKQRQSELKGAREHLMSELKKQWNCDTIDEAEARLDQMERDIEKKEEEINNGLIKLQEKYDLTGNQDNA